MQAIIDLYQHTFGCEPSHIAPLAKAGSNRQYYRLTHADGQTVIGVIGTSLAENKTFIYLAKHFKSVGCNVPEIVAQDEATCCYLQTDLGSTSLYDVLQESHTNEAVRDDFEALFIKTIKNLAHLQIKGAQNLNAEALIAPRFFNEESIMFDLNYFKYCFLKPTDVPFDETLLECDFRSFASMLAGVQKQYKSSFLYRDFQARNIMVVDQQPYFIDFQGGMIGPPQYDVVSLLWQASAEYSEVFRSRMIDVYLNEMNELVPLDKTLFKEQLKNFVLFRTIQVLGAYALRGYFEKKAYFLNSIPKALANLKQLLDEGVASAYPCLEAVLQKLVALKSHSETPTQSSQEGTTIPDAQVSPLHVRVFSFSYKKSGIPHDESGNGGGYVFDCRSTHNPGKYALYKALTGLDQPVIDFLEKDGEILSFLKHVYGLADAHVQRYIQRGFTNLMFAFGCTGGQHRSVYSAQHLAEYLHKKYHIKVTLEHREQGIVQEFEV